MFATGVAARETAQALRTLAQAARGVAASTVEPQAAAAMLDSACHVMEGSSMLIHEAHQALVCPGDAESQQRLAQVGRRRFNTKINRCLAICEKIYTRLHSYPKSIYSSLCEARILF